MRITEDLPKQLVEKLKEFAEQMSAKPLTVDEARSHLGVSKSYLYKLTSQGEITYYKPNGKLIYFKREDLDKWAYRHRVLPGDEVRHAAR